uniref:Uncharacterized protein n=1 Tax=Arundo donax TaxID=35708 RepID=A0A0A8YV72_ARUDO
MIPELHPTPVKVGMTSDGQPNSSYILIFSLLPRSTTIPK